MGRGRPESDPPAGYRDRGRLRRLECSAASRNLGTRPPAAAQPPPAQLRFEDGYEIDVEDYIGRRSPVALVDADRVASFDVLRRRRGWTASFTYDTEKRGPLAASGEVLRFIAEYRF